jgi:cohesin complex subunit SCC1
MFFELLNLGTRDMVKLQQDMAYGDIHIRAKPKLFETVAQSRAESELPEPIAV